MKIISLKKRISHNLLNIAGKRINNKVVLIESDDWGAIRMSGNSAYLTLLKKGYPINKCPYNTNDALESNKDLEMLFDTLSSIKGADGNPAKFTANNIVANPDFVKIKSSGFQRYYYEPFTETLKRYPHHNNVVNLYQQGIDNLLFIPQFHGREHLNVIRWMNALRIGSKPELDAFEEGVFSPKIAENTGYRNEYMDAFDADNKQDIAFNRNVLKEGLELFTSIWGFDSTSFIAPCYIWHSDLEYTLSQNGVNWIQGLVKQMEPSLSGNTHNYISKYHYQGQKNTWGQHYGIRNAFFEPSLRINFDWNSDCLKRIETAFLWRKPAIISSHRLNYIGWLNPKNRDENLKKLNDLLQSIVKKWPDVRFISTNQLLEYYT